jgi:uncharacterized protein (TIGR02452 family)
MIKKNGIALMNARSKNVSIAKETMEIVKQKQYIAPSGRTVEISQAVDNCIEKTALYKSDSQFPDTDWKSSTPVVEVRNETTTQAALRLLRMGKTNLAALNFASARNQGGGFLAGAIAQEEDLCRASALYACLKRKPVFYNENILCGDTFYTDNAIYSPDVPFFRDSDSSFLEDPFTLSIVSAPAPNLTALTGRVEGLGSLVKGILRERAIRVLNILAAHGHENIILGAWGCGAFGNDPEMVADVFKLALEKIPAFQHVCFPVYDTREPPVLYNTFYSVLQTTSKST